MIKKIYISSLLVFITLSVNAQFDAVTKAFKYLQANQIDSAQKYIDIAANDDNLKEKPNTHYYRGFVYKELYKTKEKDLIDSKYREEAIKSLKTCIQIDSKKEFYESSVKMLKYLASTLYNDAVRSLDIDHYKIAEQNYQRFKELMQMVEPSQVNIQRDIKFMLALGSIFSKESDTGSGIDSAKAAKAKEIYLKVLELDSNNASANYNMAILYYNEAVYIINNLDYDVDIEKLNALQDHCIDLFLKALPYMKKAYALNWKKRESLIGLSSIYLGLNDVEKSEFYKQELKKLEQQNNEKSDPNDN